MALLTTLVAGLVGVTPALARTPPRRPASKTVGRSAADRDSAQASQSGGTMCLRQATPPAPPPGGAVFAVPLATDPDPSDPNVVVIASGSPWGTSSCGASAAATAVMTHPTSIAVGAGAAVVLYDNPDGLVSAWGAKDVGPGDPAPVLYPGDAGWTTTTAQIVDQQMLLHSYSSCRACSIPNIHFTPTSPSFTDVAYLRDLSGADLSGTTLTGNFSSWNLTGANLRGADLSGADQSGDFSTTDLSRATLSSANLSGVTLDRSSLAGAVLDHTVVDGTVFRGTDLDGTHLVGLQYHVPPIFNAVPVGSANGSCTTFQDTDLVHVMLQPVVGSGADCKTSPLFPGSSVSLELIKELYGYGYDVDLAGADIVVLADDRAKLAGANLDGIDLAGASFVGMPVDLSGANFDDASLRHTSFEKADLSGATFEGADAVGASFRDAILSAHGNVKGTSFAGSKTDLQDADFAQTNVSGATFQDVDLTGADFTRALAVGTDFNAAVAPNAAFNGAHIYGDGQAFDSATNLEGADFSDAVLAGDVGQGSGFDLTHADLTGAKFDATQCIGCNFTGSKLDQANFSGAYLPGAVFSGATLTGANFIDASLYCGDPSNDSCSTVPGSEPRWAWSLALGSGEAYGPVPFDATDLTGVSFDDVTTCPDGKDGSNYPQGCVGDQLLPDPAQAPPIPAPCSAAGPGLCPTATSTLFDATALGAPLAVVAATPPTWATTLNRRGYDVALDNGTIELVGDGPTRIVAGTPGRHCASPTAACGDGGPATAALLGAPSGLAVGLDGSLYVADPTLHRVRRIDPSGTITTVAGTGVACPSALGACGFGGPATAAELRGPYGVWAAPDGELWIADGDRGVRHVKADGTITTVPGTDDYDVRSIVGAADGTLYATTNDPAYLIEIDTTSGQATKVVGTGTSGYNGNTDSLGLLLPGTSVQIDHPEGLSLEPNGDVVFADTDNDLIRAYVPSSGHVIDLGGVVANGTPQGGFNGDGHWADQTELDLPQDVAISGDGLFVVADTHNAKVRQFGPSPAVSGDDLDDVVGPLVQEVRNHPIPTAGGAR
jgi:uncharacterized protein YjbI with pentapeptide repeats